MGFRTACAVAGSAALLVAGPARAAEKNFYFHKQGVSREAYVADVNECTELAGGARGPSYVVISANPYAAAVGALFGGILGSAEERRMERSVQRTCMADKGYSRMRVERDLVKKIRKLEGEARIDRLFALAASSEPVGERLPR